MIALALALTLGQVELSDRTPSIYRCPQVEAEGPRFESLITDHHYTEICVEPKAGPKAKAIAAKYPGKVKFISSAAIDTKANLAWRNATMEFVLGKISPRAWLDRTQKLNTTAHFLASPRTPDLRTATGQKTLYSVFGELIVCAWPGKPCFTSTDVWRTRYFPDDKRHISWILAMNDWLGPMLQYRFEHPVIVTGKPKIIRADKTPGMLIFSHTTPRGILTYYLNNGKKPLELPPFDIDRVTINRGLNIDGPKPVLNECGFLIEDRTTE